MWKGGPKVEQIEVIGWGMAEHSPDWRGGKGKQTKREFSAGWLQCTLLETGTEGTELGYFADWEYQALAPLLFATISLMNSSGYIAI